MGKYSLLEARDSSQNLFLESHVSLPCFISQSRSQRWAWCPEGHKLYSSHGRRYQERPPGRGSQYFWVNKTIRHGYISPVFNHINNEKSSQKESTQQTLPVTPNFSHWKSLVLLIFWYKNKFRYFSPVNFFLMESVAMCCLVTYIGT